MITKNGKFLYITPIGVEIRNINCYLKIPVDGIQKLGTSLTDYGKLFTLYKVHHEKLNRWLRRYEFNTNQFFLNGREIQMTYALFYFKYLGLGYIGIDYESNDMVYIIFDNDMDKKIKNKKFLQIKIPLEVLFELIERS